MTREEYRAAAENVIYLAACMVNGDRPDAGRAAGMDLRQLHEAAAFHMLTGVVGFALEAAGVEDAEFVRDKAAAMRRSALYIAERTAVLAKLEEAGIWYMPLKGAVLESYYPRLGMRQMADNDILFDPSRRADVREIMTGLGFTTEDYGFEEHDVYFKDPFLSFEMHVGLINSESVRRFDAYYLDVKKRLLKDAGNAYGYHFSDEDFYLYLLAHEYKHYAEGGTGLRSLLDTYVWLKRKRDEMDWDYIAREAEKMGIADFEWENRSLATRLFTGEALSESEGRMLDFILSSGTYGTVANRAEGEIREKGRLGYFLSRLTIPKETMLHDYPILKKAPALYPVMWLWRFIYRFFTRREKLLCELKAVFTRSK